MRKVYPIRVNCIKAANFARLLALDHRLLIMCQDHEDIEQSMATHIQVEFIGPFREITGMKQFVMDVEAQATLGQAIGRLAERFGPKFRERVLEDEGISEDVIVVLNSRPILPSEMGSIILSEGDRVLVMPECAI